MTQQEMEEYYKHIESASFNLKEFGEIEIIDLYHEKGDSNRHVHLVFEQNKLYYTGDMGTYVFGENIYDVKTFFKGSVINPYYWMEKVEAASELILDDPKEEEILKRIEQYCLEVDISKEELEEAISNTNFCIDGTNKVDTINEIIDLLNELDYEGVESTAYEIYENSKDYNSRFIYACNLIQWVENEVL